MSTSSSDSSRALFHRRLLTASPGHRQAGLPRQRWRRRRPGARTRLGRRACARVARRKARAVSGVRLLRQPHPVPARAGRRARHGARGLRRELRVGRRGQEHVGVTVPGGAPARDAAGRRVCAPAAVAAHLLAKLARSLAGLRRRRSAKSGARRSTVTAKGSASSRLGRSSALLCPPVSPAASAGKASAWTRICLLPLPPAAARYCLSVAGDERGEKRGTKEKEVEGWGWQVGPTWAPVFLN